MATVGNRWDCGGCKCLPSTNLCKFNKLPEIRSLIRHIKRRIQHGITYKDFQDAARGF